MKRLTHDDYPDLSCSWQHYLQFNIYICLCSMTTYLKENQHNHKKWRADNIMELFYCANFKQALKQLHGIDYIVNIIALTILTYNNSNQTHNYRCTTYTLSIPLCFLLFSLTVSHCFWPPAHQSWEWLDQTSACLLLTAQMQQNKKKGTMHG